MRALILIAAVLAMFYTPASAQTQTCVFMPHDATIERLENTYGERVIFMGISGNSVLEVFVNPETETWSVLATFPNLGACMKASGTGFEMTDPVTSLMGDDT